MSSNHSRSAVILAALRTPMGRFGGALSSVRPDDLAAIVVKEAVSRSRVDPAAIDDVIMGCANQAGEDNRNVARMAAILADLPFEIPGVTVNRLCASGLEALNQAARAIICGEADIVVAGGVESMSRAPFSMPRPGRAFPRGGMTLYDTALGWRYPNPAMEARFPLLGLGVTAENIAEKYDIGREEQDRFALESHRKAIAARDALAEEIVPVTLLPRRGPARTLLEDETPRKDTSLEKLAKLAPVFSENGTVTAGSSSPLSDGAAALVLANEDKARSMGLRPLARYVGSAAAGVHPNFMGLGPVPATAKLLDKLGLDLGAIDRIELNEAFAAQVLGVLREWKMSQETAASHLNVRGGAIALGHPLGASGARLAVTLVHQLSPGQVGLATLCVGVGQGVSTVIERLS